MMLIHQVCEKLATEARLEAALDQVVQLIQRAFDYHRVALFLVENQAARLQAVAGSGSVDGASECSQSLNEGLVGWVIQHRQKLVVNETCLDPRFTNDPVMQAEACLPLKTVREFLGVLDIQSPHPNVFSDDDVTILEILANHVALAIEKARLYEASQHEVAERQQPEQLEQTLAEKRIAYQQAQQYAADLVEKIKEERRQREIVTILDAELKQTQAQLIQRERLALLGQMAAMIAHELRNPLMTMRIGLECLLSDISESTLPWEGAGRLQVNMDRIDRIIEDILSIARTPQPVLAPSSLGALIETETGQWEARLASKQISCSLQLAPDLPPAHFDPDQLSRVLANLFANSLDAMPGGGEIIISLELKDKDQVIVFADNGAGMPTEDVDKIFEPFFTTKPRGTGLGLFIVSRIVENHGGTITVWSQPGCGTRFTITLPSAGGSL